MSQIAAAENIVIRMLPERWQLIQNSSEKPRVLLEAKPAEDVRYTVDFGSTRRLPTQGRLHSADVYQVIVGWSQEAQSWHLGLILSRELTATRGSRWCELARWPDPDQTVFIDSATETGANLARVLGKPFYRVDPQPIAPAQPMPLPAFPLNFGVWTMGHGDASGHPEEDKLFLVRSQDWLRNRYWRIFWYCVWTVAYLILSIATLTSEIALPNAGTLLPDPRLLPFLGLLTAVVLLFMIGRRAYEIYSQPDTFMIDTTQNMMSAWRGDRQIWSVNGLDVRSVYVTEVVKRNATSTAIEHGELNIHLGGGDFHFILQLEDGEAEPNTRLKEPVKRTQDEVVPLMADNVNTDLQAAALHIATALGDIPAWYDVRVKWWLS